MIESVLPLVPLFVLAGCCALVILLHDHLMVRRLKLQREYERESYQEHMDYLASYRDAAREYERIRREEDDEPWKS